MRRTALKTTMALAVAALMLTACSGQADEPQATPEGTACAEDFQMALTASGFDPAECWTLDRTARETVTDGQSIYFLNAGTAATSDHITAVDSSDGSILWETPEFTKVSEFPSAPSLRIFSDGTTTAVMLGYFSAGQFILHAYDAETGEQMFEDSLDAGGDGNAIWGHNAVAVNSSAGNSVLTLTSRAFTPVSTIPWTTQRGVPGDPGVGEPVTNILYVTEDRIVTDLGITADGTEGLQIADQTGAVVGRIPMSTGNPGVSFVGHYALHEAEFGTKAAWVDLSTGEPVAAPDLDGGETFASAPIDTAEAKQLAPGHVSPDGSTILANMRYGFHGGEATKIPADLFADVLTDTRGYASTGRTIDLATWQPTDDLKTPSGASIHAAAEADGSTVLIFGGPFGVGGVREP